MSCYCTWDEVNQGFQNALSLFGQDFCSGKFDQIILDMPSMIDGHQILST